MSSKFKNPLFIAFLIIFMDLLGFGLLIPIQPFYAKHFGASPTEITLLGASYSLMQFIFTPFWGRLSDRIGRRPIILISVLISGIGFLLFGLAESMLMLFVSRMVAGFGNANIGAVQAVISDTTSSENRAKSMGLIGAAFGLGFILGPVFGGVLGHFGSHYPPLFAALISFFNLIFAWKYLPETLKLNTQKTQKIHHTHSAFSLKAFQRAVQNLSIGKLLLISLVSTLAFSMLEQVVGLLISDVWVLPLNLSADDLNRESTKMFSIFMVVVGVMATFVQGYLIRKVSKKYSEKKLLPFAVTMLFLSMFLIPVLAEIGNFKVFLLVTIVLALGNGFLQPNLVSFLSKLANSDDQGGVLGLNQSCSALGRVIGPAISGILFERARYLPFYVGAIIMIGAIVVAISLKSSKEVA